MGYYQNTLGVTATGPLPPIIFNAPICAQLAIQVSASNAQVNLEFSLDGVNFVSSSYLMWHTPTHSSGQILGYPFQSFLPIAAMRANVMGVGGSADITIVAAPLNSE